MSSSELRLGLRPNLFQFGLLVAANVLLGASQGLTWSTTVVMKIDLVGPRQRGLAMGLNEAAGWVRSSGRNRLCGGVDGGGHHRAVGFACRRSHVRNAPACRGTRYSVTVNPASQSSCISPPMDTRH